MKTKFTKSVFLFSLSQIFFISICFSNNHAAAQKIPPKAIKQTGTVLQTLILAALGGAAHKFGSEAASRIINSQEKYVKSWVVQDPYGNTYDICQNFQNNQAISDQYYC
ncbi:conserved exported hypothetical protein [Hyella patelloides LEGE 07179]|uniref:Uncharacterized protein n=1 Tax=Hyella patelloides LEGE 07179 TaxID=945734 RepID=A0A563W2K2_9CYAN|nr:hypothetical protein [Hyella patelloides]VEP17934.1 conserved exported hypothetical protein [Hyella patelloides LEGE 07179]